MIDKEIKKSDCTGCYACANVCPKEPSCISMIEDEEGFWYPRVDYDKCIKCGLCISTCPVLNYEPGDNAPRAYACINKDELIRVQSSSGGLFTLIAEQILEEEGVVFGAKFNDDFEVIHDFTETKEGVDEFRGSKYVQSRIGNTYMQTKHLLESGRKVLFTGTPCQIAGLVAFLKETFDNLFCVDIICHGVPSAKVWKKYIELREKEAGSPTQRISFRLKNEGWKRYSVSFLFKNDTEYRQNLKNDLYMRAFLKDLCLRPSCYNCKFKTLYRISDMTLADFWGIQNIAPDMDDDRGTSLLFINSKSGMDMFERIKDKIAYKEVDINEAVKYNTAAYKSARYNPNRDRFMQGIINDEPFDILVKEYGADKTLGKIKRKMESFMRKVFEP